MATWGRGQTIFDSKYEYIGEHKKDRRHGHGMCVYSNEDQYKDDKKHGPGILKYSDGSTFEDEWLNDKVDVESAIDDN